MRVTLQIFALFLLISITGCGSTLPKVDTYKLDIQQGNVVTSKMLLKLRPGMTKSQVKFIMGTPLIVDGFHDDRWDYFYQLRQNGKIVKQRRVILDFEDQLLARVRGDVVPEGTPGADTGDEPVSRSIANKKDEKKGVIDRLKFWNKDKENQSPANAIEEGQEAAQNQPLEAAAPIVATDESEAVLEEAIQDEAELQATVQEEISNAEEVVEDAANDLAVEEKSVLAVPVPLAAPLEVPEAPAVEIPSAEANAVEQASKFEEAAKETVGDEMQKVEAAESVLEEAPEAPKTEELTLQETEIETPEVEGVSVESAKEMAVPAPMNEPVNIKGDDPLVFRMDRSLDTTRIKDAPTIDISPANAVKEAPVEEVPDPGFFERMLEKIGF